MKKLILILFIALLINGCNLTGSGGLGGQGISLHADNGSTIQNIHIYIDDEGTAVFKPMD